MTTQITCQECCDKMATSEVYMDSDSFGTDTLHLCEECRKIYHLLCKQEESFVIATVSCEINGDREYLYDQETLYRVRLFERTLDGVKDALSRYREGLQNGRLYKMSF